MFTAVRRFHMRLIPAVLIVFLAGCSPTPTDDGAPAPATNGSFPVTIPHKYGSTTVEQPPKRIVTVGYTDQDAVLALDAVPVATTKWLVSDYPGAVGPWARDALGSAPAPIVLSKQDGMPFEKIAAQKPDLILGLYSGMTQEEYEQLSRLAPTIAQPGQYADNGIPWQDATRTVGTALGRRDKAERLVRNLEGRIAAVRRDNPEFIGSTAVLATTYDGYFVYGSQDPRSRVLRALGFRSPREIDDVVGNQFGTNISRERADLLDVDALIWFTPGGETTLRNDPVYSQLRVAREQRDIFIDKADDYGNAFAFSSVLSLPYVLDRLVPQLRSSHHSDPTPPRCSAEIPPEQPRAPGIASCSQSHTGHPGQQGAPPPANPPTSPTQAEPHGATASHTRDQRPTRSRPPGDQPAPKDLEWITRVCQHGM